MQVNVIFHPTATQIECHSNACATFANSNQCFFSRIPFFSGHVYVGNWRVWKTIRFFSTKHIGGCGTPGTKKIYRSLRPQPRCSCFSRSGGVTGYKNGMMFWCCSNLAVKLMILTQTYSRFGFAIATYLVCFKSMSLKPMVRHLRTMQAGSFSQFEAKLTDASSRLQVVCVDDGLTRW